MKRKLKKIVSVLLLVSILNSALPVQAAAADERASETAETWFVFDQDTNTITSYSQDIDRAPKDIVIPSTINGYEVKRIGPKAFNARVDLTSVVIPDTVTTIDRQAFKECTNLQTVDLGNGVTELGDEAFYGCTSLSTIVIPDGITQINDRVFAECGLTSVKLGDNVAEIGNSAFEKCPLTSLTIPDSVTTIAPNAFGHCEQLSQLDLGNGVETIDTGAFSSCKALTSVTIPDSVTTIGTSAFSYCDSLTTVQFGSGVTTIGTRAFANAKLADVRIPSNVSQIGSEAFSGVTSGPITIDKPTDSIAGSPWGATCLIYWNDTIILGNKYMCQTDENGNLSITAVLDKNITDATDIQTLLDAYNTANGTNYDITAIGAKAFSDCKNLTAVTIPESVTEIGNEAFNGCERLTAADIPDSVTSIGESAFAYCEGLADIKISANVDSIGSGAFYRVKGPITVDQPTDGIAGAPWGASCMVYWNDAITLGNKYLCQKNSSGDLTLTSVVDPALMDASDIQDLLDAYNAANGTNYKITTIGSGAFKNCGMMMTVKIPESVTAIESEAFSGCMMLNSIDIPDLVTDIGSKAFSGCMMLTSVTIPDQVTSLEEGVFSDCMMLASVTLPKNLTTIGKSAFSQCMQLANVKIPDSVSVIGSDAFNMTQGPITIDKPTDSIAGSPWGTQGMVIWNDSVILGNKYLCKKDENGNLTLVGMLDSTDQSATDIQDLLDAYNKANGTAYKITAIGDSAFVGCGITDIAIPETVTSIGEEAFKGCPLTTVTIPDSVTSLGKSAFKSCASLTDVTLSSGLTEIAEYTFQYCRNLTNVNIPDGVTRIGYNAFEGCSSLTDITIPDSVTAIGEEAFLSCRSLTNVTLSNQLQTIERGTFQNCSSLLSVTIPDGVTDIKYDAFYGCSGMTTVTIPLSVTNIDSGAFRKCTSLTGEITVSGHCELSSDTFAEASDTVKLVIRSARAVYQWRSDHPYGLSDDRISYIGDVPNISARAVRNEDGSYKAGVYVSFVGENGSIADGVVRVQFPRDNGKGENPPQGETFQVATGGVAEWDSIPAGYWFRVSEAGKYYMRVCGLTQDQADRDSWPICEFVVGTPEITADNILLNEDEQQALQNPEELITLSHATAKDDFDTDLTKYIQASDADLAAVKALKEGESVQITLTITHPDTDLVAQKQVTVTIAKKYAVTYVQPAGYTGGNVTSDRMLEGTGYKVLDIAAVSSAAKQNNAAEWIVPEDTTFNGWQGSDGKVYQPDAVITMTANLTLTAMYTKKNTGGNTDSGGHGGHSTPADLNSDDHIRYVMGFEDGTVRPEANITRAQFATMLYRLLRENRRDQVFTTSNSYSDVTKDLWYNKAVSSMSNGGYIYGYSDGTFRGEQSITRAEFVAMLVRFIGVNEKARADFSDVAANYWAYQYIATATEAGWIQGYQDNTYRPNQAITRAEAMVIVNRVLDRGVSAKSKLGSFQKFSDNAPTAWYYWDVIEATNDHTYTGKRPTENWNGLKIDYSYDVEKYERP